LWQAADAIIISVETDDGEGSPPLSPPPQQRHMGNQEQQSEEEGRHEAMRGVQEAAQAPAQLPRKRSRGSWWEAEDPNYNQAAGGSRRSSCGSTSIWEPGSGWMGGDEHRETAIQRNLPILEYTAYWGAETVLSVYEFLVSEALQEDGEYCTVRGDRDAVLADFTRARHTEAPAGESQGRSNSCRTPASPPMTLLPQRSRSAHCTWENRGSEAMHARGTDLEPDMRHRMNCKEWQQIVYGCRASS